MTGTPRTAVGEDLVTLGPFGSASDSQTWCRYDHHDKPGTAPPDGELVWVYEEYDLVLQG